MSLCATVQAQTTPPAITLTGLAEKYAPGFPADVNVWVTSNDYIDSYCKVGFTIKKDGRAVGNVADFGTISYRIRLAGNTYSDWTPITTGSGYITQEVPLENGSRVVVESFTLGIFEHTCVDRGRPIEFKATFDEIGTYTIDVNVFQVDAVAPYVTEVGTFSCLNSDDVHHDMVALTSSNPRQVATEQIVVDVVPSYEITFVGLGDNVVTAVGHTAENNNLVMQGDDYVFSITSGTCVGTINSVTVDGNALSAVNGKYTIANVRSNKTVNVDFSTSTYTITANTPENGTVRVPASVSCGSAAEITFVPASSLYSVGTVILDKGTQNQQDLTSSVVNNTLSIANVKANHTLDVEFVRSEIPTIAFGTIDDKYAPGFPANVEATINSHGYLDKLCMVEYVVKRNGEVISNIEDYGTVKFSVRLQGDTPIEKYLTAGSGVVNEEVVYNNHTYQINAFTASIFDNSSCLNRWRPINFLATFTEIGEYEVTVKLYQALVDNHQLQVSALGTSYPNACDGGAIGYDSVAFNAIKGVELTSLSQTVNVVPSYEINFVGLGADNTITADGHTADNMTLAMQGDDYVFSIDLMNCQQGITSVTVDGSVLTANNGKYTIPNVRSNKTVNVVFETTTYAITTTDATHISVPSSPINCGENAVVTINPDANLVLEALYDNGTDVTAQIRNNTYTINNVTAAHEITATYGTSEYPTLSFDNVADKYAPDFPAEVIARINSHGYMNELCMVEYAVTRNGEPIANISDYGSVSFSVRLAGSENITRNLTAGSGIVNETVDYNGNTYEINAFTASIFDNSTCLNRMRPITFTAAFTEIGNYEVTVNLYKAVVDHPELQISDLGTTYINTCNNNAEEHDRVAFNALKGDLIATLSQTVNVVPSYKITFNGLSDGNNITVDLPAKNDSVMQGDDYVFAISLLECQSSITSVTVDGQSLNAENGKYTIANVRSDKTVNVTFASQNYVVSTSGDNCSFDPQGSSVECGSSFAVTITPDPGYEIASATDNGEFISIVNGVYTIENVLGNHNIVIATEELTHPTISFENIADKYAPGFPADVVARVNSHADETHGDRLDQLCMVEYTISRNGQIIRNISDFGTVSFKVRLSGSDNYYSRDLESGYGYISEVVDYQPEGQEMQHYTINAFTVGIFDNSDCQHRDRPIKFHATFNEIGTYEINVKLYSASVESDQYLATVNTFLACDGQNHNDQIALSATQGDILDELTQVVNVVPSYNVTFNGLADANIVVVDSTANNPLTVNSVMEGDDYIFNINNLIDCQEAVSRVTANGNIVALNGGWYTVADVHEDLNIEVAFEAHSYTVTANAGDNGTVEVDAPVVACNDDAVVTITPAANYTIATVTDNGIDVSNSVANNTYTISNIVENHTINVTFEALAHPTIVFGEIADKYAPGFPADVVATVDSHEAFEQLCKVQYTITRNGQPITNVSEFGSVSYTVRLAGDNMETRNITNGQGFISETVEYEGESYDIDAFSVSIFDSNTCLNHQRPINFHATFTQTGTYEVNVKLWSAEQTDPMYIQTIHTVTDCHGVSHEEKIAINATALAVLDEVTQIVNVVPSYAITFNGLAEGNTVNVQETERVRQDSIMEGENYVFSIDLADCQDAISRVTVNGNIILPSGNLYTVTDVREDLNIEVAFNAHSYTINATAGANGTVDVSVPVVSCGGSAEVTITPDAHFSIASVMDGANDVTAEVVNNVYTLDNINENHEINVTFVADAVPTIAFDALPSDKYAPNFPVEAVARINSNGNYDRMCKVEYIIKRNGRVVNNISDFGSVSYSVRLAGTSPVTKELTSGSGFVSEAVEYEGETYNIDAFSVGIFDNNACLNRNRPINLLASFSEIGYYEVTVNVYDANDIQLIDTVNTYEDCNHEQHYDMIAVNTNAGQLLATETISVEVVPSFKITFVGLEDGNEVVADAPAHADSVMYGDNYVFAINGLAACQTAIESVEVDGTTLTADASGKYTIADVRENKTVNVTFTLQSFAITAATVENGTITVPTENVTCGEDAEITITPDTNYEIADVTIDGQSIGAVSSYTIQNVTAAHEVSATFTASVLPEIIVDESTIAEKYAPGFPADITAHINTNGNYDRICKIGYAITRNGETVERVSDFGTASYSVRLAGNEPISRDIVTGSGFVSEVVNYNDQPYSIDAFSAGIFDSSDCLNRHRPLNFHATFNEVGDYKVVITMYEANYTDGQVSSINTYADCNGVQHDDMIGYNTSAGAILATKEISVHVVPSYVVTFEGLEGIAEHTSYEPANGDTIMEGDSYIFSLEVAQATTACQASIDKVTVDDAELTADAEGKYTIANVDANKVVKVTFTYPAFAITASATNGTAIVDNAEVTCGENATVTFAANDGFELASVTDNDVDVTAQVVNNTYTLENVVEAHNVVATFTAIVLPEIVVDESTIAEKYAPGFPADITAHINTNGNYDRICKIGYAITRNGETVERVSDFGTASYSVRLAGNEPISRDIVTGSGFVSEVVNYNDQPYSIDAFSAGIFDSSDCLNRHRPLNFHATFNEVGDYKVVITMYEANYTDGQVSSINTYADCNGVQHDDMIGYNTSAGAILATKEISVHVVPSYVVTFEGLEGIAEHTSYEPANGDTIMEGDSYIFSLEVAQATTACQASIDKVTVDDAELTADAEGKYTIANVDANKVVKVTFTYPAFAITASATNGTAIVDNAEVTCGENATVTFAANDGFELASVTDNDVDVTSQIVNNTYTLVNVVEAHNVVVTFNEIVYPTIAFDSIAPKYAPGFPADVIGRINSEGNPDRMVKVGYEVTRNGQPVDRISDYGTLSYSVRLAGTNTITRDIENGNGFISERVDYEGATYYIDAFTVGIFDNNTCVNRNRPVELHAAFDSIGEYSVTIKLYDVDTTHALVDVIGSFTDCNGVSHNDKIAISARATNEIASLTQIVNVVPSYLVTFEGLAEGNTHTSYAPAINDSIMQGDNFIFSLEGTAACQTGIASVATADGATLTADAEGKYTIENVQSDMTVNVTYNYSSFAINVETDGNGTAVARPDTVMCGDSVAVYITPNEYYEIASVTLDGDDVTANVTDGVYVINNVTAAHDVYVTFNEVERPYYHVTFEGLEEGNTVVSETADTVRHGDNYVFGIELTECQSAIDTVYVGGLAVVPNEAGSYTIENVVSDTTVLVTFVHRYFTIATVADNNGTVVAMPESVYCGDSAVVFITPNDNYEIESVVLDSVDVTANLVVDSTSTYYVINNVTADHTVTVTFSQIPYYTVTFVGLEDENEVVSATGDTVRRGDNYVFAINGLAQCQAAIDTVYVGGQILTADDNGNYTIENVVSDTTVTVTFRVATYAINVTADNNGTVVVTPETITCGDSAVIVITPNENYEIESVMLDSLDITAEFADSTYTLMNIVADHALNVTFVNIPSYVITFEGLVEGNTHVVYEPANGDTVMRGENYIFGLEGLADCQEAIDSVSVNGQALVADDEGHYTIENVQSDLTVNVAYVTSTYTIAMFAGEHGSVAADTVTVDCGSDYEVVFTPAAGYQIGTVTMDSTDVTENVSGNSLMLTNIHDNHTVSATFVIIPPESPYVEFVGLENSYASGDTIDFELKLHANRVLDNLCAVGYELRYYNTDTTSTVVADATRYGVFNYSVNITDTTVASNIIRTGSGLLNATAQYGNNTYDVSAFTLGLFDSECAGRDRDIDFDAVFSVAGRYQFNVSLYTCANGGTAIGTRYEACDGMIHYDRVDAVCDSMTVINTATQEIEISGETLYTITASVIGSNGTVEPNGTVVVNAGSTYDVVFIPDENYAIDTVKDNGFIRYPVEGSGYVFNNVYTLTNISENHNITVTYRDIRAYYNIHVEVESAGGDVTPRDTTVVDGADVTLIVTPNSGYHISQLEIDGNLVTNCETNEIIFHNVQADHIVKIAFFPNSIDEEAFSDLSVYPNPNNGKFTVSSTEFEGEVTLQLFNASGAAIDERTLTDQEYVDYDRELPTGTYILRIISGDKVATRKIVVE